MPPPAAPPVTPDADGSWVLHRGSEEQSEWNTAWYTELEICFAMLASTTILVLLVLCFCC